MKSFTMKDATLKPSTDLERLQVDERGCFFDPQTRALLSSGVEPETLRAVEAIAALRVAAHGLHRVTERWAENNGLSEGRLQILFRLRQRREGVALGELAELMSVSPRNITGLIDNLERDGLVSRVPDPADRRSVIARLTPEGERRIKSIWKAAINHQLPVVEGLTTEELQQLRHLCLKLARNFAGRMKKGEKQ